MGGLDISACCAREQWALFPLIIVEDLTTLRRFDIKCDNFSVFFKSVTFSQRFSKASANEAGQAERALHIASKRKRKEEGKEKEKGKRGKRKRGEEGRGRGGGCAPRGARISQCSGREEGQAQTKQGARASAARPAHSE